MRTVSFGRDSSAAATEEGAPRSFAPALRYSPRRVGGAVAEVEEPMFLAPTEREQQYLRPTRSVRFADERARGERSVSVPASDVPEHWRTDEAPPSNASSGRGGRPVPSAGRRASDLLVPRRVYDPALGRAFGAPVAPTDGSGAGGFAGAMPSFYGGRYAEEERRRGTSPKGSPTYPVPRPRRASTSEQQQQQQQQQQPLAQRSSFAGGSYRERSQRAAAAAQHLDVAVDDSAFEAPSQSQAALSRGTLPQNMALVGPGAAGNIGGEPRPRLHSADPPGPAAAAAATSAPRRNTQPQSFREASAQAVAEASASSAPTTPTIAQVTATRASLPPPRSEEMPPQHAEVIAELRARCASLSQSMEAEAAKHRSDWREQQREIVMLRAALVANSSFGAPPALMQDPSTHKKAPPPHCGGLPFRPVPLQIDGNIMMMHGYLEMLELNEPKVFKKSWKRRYVMADDRGLRVFKDVSDVKRHAFHHTSVAASFRDFEYFVPYFHSSTAGDPQMYHPHASDLTKHYFGFVAKQPIGSESAAPMNPAIVFRTESSTEHEDWAHYFARSFNPRLYQQQFPTLFRPQDPVVCDAVAEFDEQQRQQEASDAVPQRVQEGEDPTTTAQTPARPEVSTADAATDATPPPPDHSPPAHAIAADAAEDASTPAPPSAPPPEGALSADAATAEGNADAAERIITAGDAGEGEQPARDGAEDAAAADGFVSVAPDAPANGRARSGGDVIGDAVVGNVKRPTPTRGNSSGASPASESQQLREELAEMKMQVAASADALADAKRQGIEMQVEAAAAATLREELRRVQALLSETQQSLEEERDAHAQAHLETAEMVGLVRRLEDAKARLADDCGVAEDHAAALSEALRVAQAEAARLHEQLNELHTTSRVNARAEENESESAELLASTAECYDAATQVRWGPAEEQLTAAAPRHEMASTRSPATMNSSLGTEEGTEGIQENPPFATGVALGDELEQAVRQRDEVLHELQRRDDAHRHQIEDICAQVVEDMDRMHRQYLTALQQLPPTEGAADAQSGLLGAPAPLVMIEVQRESPFCSSGDGSEMLDGDGDAPEAASFAVRCAIDSTSVLLQETRGDNSKRLAPYSSGSSGSLLPTRRGYTFQDLPTGATLRVDVEVLPPSLGLTKRPHEVSMRSSYHFRARPATGRVSSRSQSLHSTGSNATHHSHADSRFGVRANSSRSGSSSRPLALRGPSVEREWRPSRAHPVIPHTSPIK